MQNNRLSIFTIKSIGLLLLVTLSLSSYGQKGDDSLKVLFVGNSFIYFFNMPQVVSSMVNQGGGAMIARKSTVGGSNLEQHWKGEKGTKTMKLLEEGKWDYVVFNNHSRSAYQTPESFMEYGKKFADKVREKGAKPIFMITWAYESNPLMQTAITEGYLKLSKETGADLVHAGPLFGKARKLRPDIDLFHDNSISQQLVLI